MTASVTENVLKAGNILTKQPTQIYINEYEYIKAVKLSEAEQQKNKLQKAIQKDQYTINQLENLDSLERFAREHYGHKKDNETLFLIDFQHLVSK